MPWRRPGVKWPYWGGRGVRPWSRDKAGEWTCRQADRWGQNHERSGAEKDRKRERETSWQYVGTETELEWWDSPLIGSPHLGGGQQR